MKKEIGKNVDVKAILIFLFFSINTLLFAATSSGDYFRSKITGSWNTAGNWQSSSDNVTWATSTLVPTSFAASITIQSGHTITINTNVTAPSITILGTGKLTFDGSTARTISVLGDVTISSSGSFITQSSGTFSNVMYIGGDLINSGTFDMSRGGSTLVCNVTFNKNGNQSISGSGSTTRFNIVTVDMGTSSSNILEISSSNFQAASNFLHYNSNSTNELLNGTIKFSGTFTFSNSIFYVGKTHEIVSTAGLWLNNPNVTISATTDSWDVSGILRITQGTMNIGTTSGNSLRSKGSSGEVIIEGGSLNIAGRLGPTSSGGNAFTYNQSGGTVIVTTVGSGSSSIAAFDMSSSSSNFIMSGGSLIIRNKTSNSKDYNNPASTYSVTGGTVQFGDASTPNSTVFTLSSTADLPNVIISNANSQATKPKVLLASNINIVGNLTIMSGTTLDVSTDGGTTNYNTKISGTWSNSGTFTSRNKTVTFDGSVNQSIEGSSTTSFYNLTNSNSSSGLTLNHGIMVTNILSMSGATADIYLNSYNIDLSSTGNISGESNNDRIYGSSGLITTTLTINSPSALNVGGMGGILTSASNLGTTTMSRGHGQQDVNGNPSLLRYYIINPTNDLGLNATLVYNYFDKELNGYSANESDLTLFKSEDSGSSWVNQYGAINTSNNTITLSNIGSFSWWTASLEVNIPLSIQMIEFKAKLCDNGVVLNWDVITEDVLSEISIERSKDGMYFYSIYSDFENVYKSTFLDRDYVKGVNYYRLMVVSQNGDISYSNIESVGFNEKDLYIVKTINSLGQEIPIGYSGLVLDVYNNGTKIMRMQ